MMRVGGGGEVMSARARHVVAHWELHARLGEDKIFPQAPIVYSHIYIRYDSLNSVVFFFGFF